MMKRTKVTLYLKPESDILSWAQKIRDMPEVDGMKFKYKQ